MDGKWRQQQTVDLIVGLALHTQSTIISLMAVKMNTDECCLDVELSSELLKSCKQATRSSMTN